MLPEVIALSIGPAIAKAVLCAWFNDQPIASNISSTLIDILTSHFSSHATAKRVERQLQDIGDRVSAQLLPLFESEGARLDESSLEAVAYEVASTFNQSTITAEAIVGMNLDPHHLAKHLLASRPDSTKLLSLDESELYRRIIREASIYVVQIASQLPLFQEAAVAEILRRQGQILTNVEGLLDEIRRTRETVTGGSVASQFEADYRYEVVERFNKLELLGSEVPRNRRQQNLSVAYITLTARRRKEDNEGKEGSTEGGTQELLQFRDTQREREESTSSVSTSINSLLCSVPRLLIRGEAGSGKTTLLKWIAVHSAGRRCKGEMEPWNDIVPFYVRLRQCQPDQLPTPEMFPRLVAPQIAGAMPHGWVHNVLKQGRGAILIDGVDEIPAAHRDLVKTWLGDLTRTFPEAHFIITSRQYAAEDGWLETDAFVDAELQSMTQSDADLFIDNWHGSIKEFSPESDWQGLDAAASHLKRQVRDSRTLSSLARNPLLCAMLCALNRDWHQHLPQSRLELYSACCKLLVEERDAQRGIVLAEYPSLNYRQKMLLLQDLSYWMMRMGQSEVATDQVDEWFESKLPLMNIAGRDVTGAGIRRLFVERTSIVREPVVGQIDFAHRTFQEFLAAQAALDNQEIPYLVQVSQDDHWHEVIVLACGLAGIKARDALLDGLITHGDMDKQHRHTIHLLAVSCLETSIELSPGVRRKVEERLERLVPPHNMTDAKALAAAGDLAVKHLARKVHRPATIDAACVRALAGIGTAESLQALGSYAVDERHTVLNELMRAWDSFDREEYAKRVLARTFAKLPFPREFDHVPSLAGFQYFTSLHDLSLTPNSSVPLDLAPLSHLSELKRLMLADCRSVADFGPLSELTQLESLWLVNYANSIDLSSFAPLRQLRDLTLRRFRYIRDFRDVGEMQQLETLQLDELEGVESLTPLAGLTQLRVLSMGSIGRVSALNPLEQSVSLQRLELSGCSELTDIGQLRGLQDLRQLGLHGCETLASLEPLADLVELKSLALTQLSSLTDVEPLTNLRHLVSLYLSGGAGGSLDHFASLENLRTLDLSKCRWVETLSPLYKLQNLQLLNLRDTEITDLAPLAGLRNLQFLSIARCHNIRDLAPLRELPHLRILDISDCTGLTTAEALHSMPDLHMVGAYRVEDKVLPFIRDGVRVMSGMIPLFRVGLELRDTDLILAYRKSFYREHHSSQG